MMDNGQLATHLRQIVDRDVPANLDGWPRVRQAVAERRRPFRARTWRWGAVAAAVLIGALLISLLSFVPRAANVSAAEVLDRAAAANGAPGSASPSYHLIATRTDVVPNRASGSTQIEIWVDGQGRYREVDTWSDQSTIVGSDGKDGWMMLIEQGRTYAARGLTANTRKEFVPSGQTDLADLLAALSKRACGPATQTGETTVAGRAAYVIHVSEQASPACGDDSKRGVQGAPITVDTTLAIDKQTFVVLRSDNASPKGTQRYEVSRIEYNPPLDASLFTFAPPAGAQVFDDPVALKLALAGPSQAKPAKAP